MTTEKTPAEIWNEAIAAAAAHLEEAVDYQWNGNRRRPSGYRSAARYISTSVPNPYGEPGPPARESPEWAELAQRSEKLGEAVALWQNAKDAYVAKYPRKDT